MKSKEYKVWYSQTNTYYIFVNAKNEEQAENKAEDILTKGEWLTAFTWIDTINSNFDDVDEVRWKIRKWMIDWLMLGFVPQ